MHKVKQNQMDVSNKNLGLNLDSYFNCIFLLKADKNFLNKRTIEWTKWLGNVETLSSSNFCLIFSLALFSSSFSAFLKANNLQEEQIFLVANCTQNKTQDVQQSIY